MDRPIRTCTIPGCKAKHYGHGLCHLHFQRNKKRGDPMHVPPRTIGNRQRGNDGRFV